MIWVYFHVSIEIQDPYELKRVPQVYIQDSNTIWVKA